MRSHILSIGKSLLARNGITARLQQGSQNLTKLAANRGQRSMFHTSPSLLSKNQAAVIMGHESSEKAALGSKMAKEFFGEEILADIRAQSVIAIHPAIPSGPSKFTYVSTLTLITPQRDDLPSRIASEYVNETCFASYARPGLEFRERSLMNIAMLIALNRSNELKIHIRAALYNGLTREQICEACRHAMVYCGVPAGRTALLVASDVFTELDANKVSSETASQS